MKDQELFELCKEVYERLPCWDNTEKCYAYYAPQYETEKIWQIIPLHEDNVDDVDEWHPLYSSDYLLEKLPKSIDNGELNWLDIYHEAEPDCWRAGYEYGKSENWGDSYDVVSETPLKALLKLVIALADAGELEGTK